MQIAVFQALDSDGDGFLKAAELWHFGLLTGFDGDAKEWREEFRLLCEEQGVDHMRGLDADEFATLIDDKENPGCHCSTDELWEIFRKVVPQHALEHAERGS